MTDEAEDQPISLGIDSEDQFEPSTAEDSDELQETMELADVSGEALQAELDRDVTEPPEMEISADQEVAEEILDVGLDDEQPLMPDEAAAEEADASLAVEGLGLNGEPTEDTDETDVLESETFSIETPTDAAEEEAPLTAEALTDPEIGLDEGIGDSADRPSGTTFDPEEDEPAAVGIAGAELNGMSVDFEQGDNFEQTDLHKDADPISIRVKEPNTEDHADEDALLNKVFEPKLEAESPQELEQTVERVVSQMLSEKIEVILTDAIEKAVEKEIGRLKKLLLDDLNRSE